MTRYVGPNDGQGRVNFEIVREAARQGHDVVLFAEQVDLPGVPPERVRAVLAPPPAALPGRLLRDQVFAFRSLRQLRAQANECDAVLANGFVTWARSDVNVAHFVHRAWMRSPDHPWRSRRDPRAVYMQAYGAANVVLERDAFRRTGRVIAVSSAVRRELIEAGVDAGRIETIPNGVDTDEFRPGVSERGRFGLPDGAVMALFAGDLKSPRKNLDSVLRALRDVPALHLAVAGRSDGSTYQCMAAELGVQDRVHFLGFQTDMPALMRSVDLLAFPPRYEPFGLVLLEALASGIPVATSRAAGGSDLISADVGAVIEDSCDTGALAAALAAWVADPDRRRAMGARARIVAELHSWPAMAARYIDVLLEAADARRGLVHA